MSSEDGNRLEPEVLDTARTAAPPFDDRTADLIIRTSDRVDFHVFKVILVEASPAFGAMSAFTPSENVRGKPSVKLAESSEVWDSILRILYPTDKMTTLSLCDYLPLLEAARKYDMARVRQSVEERMSHPAVLNTDPLRIYALSCAYELPAVALAAARASFHVWKGDAPPPPEDEPP